MARDLCPNAALPVVNVRRIAALVSVAPGRIVLESFSKIDTVLDPLCTQKLMAAMEDWERSTATI